MAALTLVVIALTSTVFAPSSGAITSDQQVILDQANALRAASGLPPLQIDPELQAVAQQWSDHMASIGQLVHPQDQYAGITTPVYWVGDDIAQGLSALGAWEQFFTSDVHRNNVIDPRFDYVGIGVTVTPDGKYWVQMKFMATLASLPQPEQPEEEPEAPAVTQDTAAPVEETVPEVEVLGETVTRNVNMAVIPPVRYGAIGLPPAEAPSSSSSPMLAIAIAVGVAVLAVLAAGLTLRSRRRAAKP